MMVKNAPGLPPESPGRPSTRAELEEVMFAYLESFIFIYLVSFILKELEQGSYQKISLS